MTFLSDFIEPLTQWLRSHPYLAILSTFVISFVESLPLVGSIIPGSLTMTAFGVLAGSGVMRIDLTFIAAFLGAISGDILSFFLGLHYSEHLSSMWPFRSYPKWLTIGKNYFACHGGKSVLIGRFVGPLRSIIPIIAGMMHMNRWRFVIANTCSAIAWSIVYVLPGILLGKASTVLSPENTSKLLIALLLYGIGLWLATKTIRWLLFSKKTKPILDLPLVKIILIVLILLVLIAPLYLGRQWILKTFNGLFMHI